MTRVVGIGKRALLQINSRYRTDMTLKFHLEDFEMRKRIDMAVFLLMVVFALVGCSGGSKNTDPSSEKEITIFSFANPAATGIINESAKTITVTVPYGTERTALVASFQTTGASVKVGSTVQISGTTPNDFTNSVVYTVTAADSSTVTYTVNASIAPNSAPVITSLTITPQPVITSANLVGSAQDPDGDLLTYAWIIGGINIDSGASTTWMSPGIAGYYSATLNVGDGISSVSMNSTISISSTAAWPKFKRDIQGTSLSPIVSAATGTLKWRYVTGFRVIGSPSIGADGTV